MSTDHQIGRIIRKVEDEVAVIFYAEYRDADRPPPIDVYKAAMLAEISRRMKARADKIVEDWDHFTRE